MHMSNIEIVKTFAVQNYANMSCPTSLSRENKQCLYPIHRLSGKIHSCAAFCCDETYSSEHWEFMYVCTVAIYILDMRHSLYKTMWMSSVQYQTNFTAKEGGRGGFAYLKHRSLEKLHSSCLLWRSAVKWTPQSLVKMTSLWKRWRPQ